MLKAVVKKGIKGDIIKVSLYENNNLIYTKEKEESGYIKECSIEYNDDGNITYYMEDSDTGIYSYRITYNKHGLEMIYTDNTGRVILHQYDEDNRLLNISDSSDCIIENFKYDENGRIIRINKSNGDKIDYKYDNDGRFKIYHKDSKGFESWGEYNKDGKEIHYKGNGFEYWKEYDNNGNLIHYKSSTGYEYWGEYNENDKLIYFKDSDGDKERYVHDENGNEIHYKSSNGFEEWYEYDEFGNEIHHKNSDGDESWSEIFNIDESEREEFLRKLNFERI